MTCAEFQELAAAYALGALEPDERRACEAHLEANEHEGCREALARARETVDALGDSVAPRKPPASVWQGIQAKLDREAPSAPARAPRAPWIVASLAVAAAAIAIVLSARSQTNSERLVKDTRTALATSENEKALVTTERDRCRTELTSLRSDTAMRDAAIALLQLPTTRLATMEPQEGHSAHARALVNFDVGRGFVLAQGLTPVEGKTYELWVIRTGHKPLPAGAFPGRKDGDVVIPIDPELLEGGADAVAISIEPGDRPPVDPTQVILVGAVPKT